MGGRVVSERYPDDVAQAIARKWRIPASEARRLLATSDMEVGR